MRRMFGLLMGICLLTLVSGAAPSPSTETQEIDAWWKDRTERFSTSETSPLVASGSYYLKAGQRLALVPGQAARAAEPITHGIISEYKGRNFAVTLVGCANVALGGKAASGTSLTLTGEEGALKADGLILQYSLQGETGRVMAFQPGTDKQKAFKGFSRYPVDLRYRVALPLTLLKQPEKVVMGTSQGLVKNFLRVGYFDFDIAGQKFRLHAYTSADAPGLDEGLFLPFKDGNAGKETYGAGRYLDPEPTKDKKAYLVDFNIAYNPLCAFSPYYNCARPPAENCISAKIRAGEKTPPVESKH